MISPDRIPESVPQQPEEVEMAPPSSQTRRDISQLIEDAGFRSGLDSDLNIPDAFPSYCAPIEEEAIEEEVIVEEAIEEATIEGEALAEEVVDEEAQGQDGTNLQSDRDTPHQIPSPIFSGFGTSPQLQPTRQTPKDVTPRPTNLTSDVTTREPLSALGSSLKTSAQQVPPAGMAPSMPSDNGLCYITDLDNTALGVELGAESQFSRPKSPRRDMSRSTPPQEAEERSQASRPHSHPESHQVSEPDDQEELGGDSTVHIHGETSQADSLPLTVPQTQEQGVQSVGLGSPKSTSDYFYDLDRLLKDNDSDDSIPDFLVSSTAPPRVNAASPAKTQSQTKRHFFSSPRQRSPDPKFVYKDDDKDEDFQPGPSRTSARRKSSSVRKVIDDDFEDVGLPEPSVSRGKLRTSQKFKQEPISSQIFIPASQIPAGTQVVDLTMSSDPPIPGGGEDEDVVKSQGLPKGSGWVQKRVRRTLRRRSSLNRERDESSEPWRARTRKSVV